MSTSTKLPSSGERAPVFHLYISYLNKQSALLILALLGEMLIEENIDGLSKTLTCSIIFTYKPVLFD